jgi:exopolysaccharide biosynthesis WecB/TagA/CpsF family protein
MDVCLVDGIGVKLAAVLLNEPRVRKVTPNDIIFDLCRELSYRKLTIALVGSQAAVLESAGEIISRAAPNLGIVVRAPGFLSHAEELSLMEELSERKPDVVILGMGQPLQEQWAVRMKVLLPTSVLFCVGGLFDYLVGPRRWADVARRFGLEWAFRFCCSPRRTSRRYLYGIPALFAYIINDYVSGFRRVVGSVLYPGQKLVGERRVETFVDKP